MMIDRTAKIIIDLHRIGIPSSFSYGTLEISPKFRMSKSEKEHLKKYIKKQRISDIKAVKFVEKKVI